MAGARRLLFVCSGNICRSPMAEAIAQQMLSRWGAPVETSSRGTLGLESYRADPLAVRALFLLGIDLTRHRSRGLAARDLAAADAVVVMEPEHEQAVEALDPGAAARVHRLWEHAESPGRLARIRDPLGGTLDDFIACRDHLIECLASWLPAFTSGA